MVALGLGGPKTVAQMLVDGVEGCGPAQCVINIRLQHAPVHLRTYQCHIYSIVLKPSSSACVEAAASSGFLPPHLCTSDARVKQVLLQAEQELLLAKRSSDIVTEGGAPPMSNIGKIKTRSSTCIICIECNDGYVIVVDRKVTYFEPKPNQKAFLDNKIFFLNSGKSVVATICGQREAALKAIDLVTKKKPKVRGFSALDAAKLFVLQYDEVAAFFPTFRKIGKVKPGKVSYMYNGKQKCAEAI